MNRAITPTTVWTSAGSKSARFLRVNYINYTGNGAVADCVLLDSNQVEVSAVGPISLTAAECETWGADAAFLGLIAAKINLTAL